MEAPEGGPVSGRVAPVDAVGRPVVRLGEFGGPVAERDHLAQKLADALYRARTKTRQILVTNIRQSLRGEPVWSAAAHIRARIAAAESFEHPAPQLIRS